MFGSDYSELSAKQNTAKEGNVECGGGGCDDSGGS